MNILNDYCDAANAIVQLQKKLAKALREAASPKCVTEIPGEFGTVEAMRVLRIRSQRSHCERGHLRSYGGG